MSRAVRRVAVAVFLASFAMLLPPAGGPVRAADRDELETLRAEIRKSRSRVGGHEQKERALLERLEQSDRLRAALRSEVRDARADADAARERLADLEVQGAKVRVRLAETSAAMSRRVVALYKSGRAGPIRFLFSSASAPELLSRVAALQTLVEYDGELVSRYRRARDTLERLEAEDREATARLEASASRLEARSRELEDERRARRSLLARVRTSRTQERGLLVELEKAARALEETLAALGDAPDGSAQKLVGQGFALRRGSLAPPVDAAIALPFGRVVDELYQTETFRKGVEFAAREGESVRAVAPGVVRFAGWFRGYGRLLIVDQGDDYFTVLGHLAEIFVSVGDPVSAGDTLGTVGDTGSLTGASLYFELRRGSDPLDPARWLASVVAVPAARAEP